MTPYRFAVKIELAECLRGSGLLHSVLDVAMYKEHPEFISPASGANLWRYMDFTKFVSLLDTSSLFFAKSSILGDPFEGAYSKVNAALRPALYPGSSESQLQILKEGLEVLRKSKFISCWHEADHESAAMWNLYSGLKNGVAIKTNFQSFAQSFKDEKDIHIGRVKYVDYDKTFIPEAKIFVPSLRKRKHFEHEHEVRAICRGLMQVAPRAITDMPVDGIYISVDLDLLVQGIVIAPYSDEWFTQLVKSVAGRYGLKMPVALSKLSETPP